MKNIILGIDVGGTNVKLGLVDQNGQIFARSSFPSKAYYTNKKDLIAQIDKACQHLVEGHGISIHQLKGVGIGLPGLINAKTGVVYSLTNIPGWKNVALKKILQQRLGVPVFIDNDANVIALGEWKWGGGLGKRNMICLTLGTGIGGGLIINHQLYRGEGFAAGEIGHIPIELKGKNCNCRSHGCLETRLGNGYLLDQAKKIFHDKKISLEQVTQKARIGDALAKKFWRRAGETLGFGLVGLVNVLNPERIVIGGGVAKAFNYMKPFVEKVIQQRAMSVQGAMVKIVQSKLGSDAGIVGTQVLVDEELRKK